MEWDCFTPYFFPHAFDAKTPRFLLYIPTTHARTRLQDSHQANIYQEPRKTTLIFLQEGDTINVVFYIGFLLYQHCKGKIDVY